jgi:Domain of unknown function (DUF3535)
MQQVAASAIAELMAGCTARQPCPNDKLLRNLVAMLCSDTSETPSAVAAQGLRCASVCVCSSRSRGQGRHGRGLFVPANYTRCLCYGCGLLLVTITCPCSALLCARAPPGALLRLCTRCFATVAARHPPLRYSPALIMPVLTDVTARRMTCSPLD